jgi:hypothetical protein
MKRSSVDVALSMRVRAVVTGLAMCVVVSCREEEPPPDAGPTQDPVAPEVIDLACALVSSCGALGSETVTTCATTALTRPGSGPRYTEEYTDCLVEAGARCDDVAGCQPTLADNPCEALGQSGFCDGDTVVSCFAGAVDYRADCAAWGLTCFEDGDRALCQGDGPSCLLGTERCEGVDAILCMGFREASFDCSDFVEGRICEMRGERAECVVPDPACDPSVTDASCEANELIFCSASGELVRIDCASIGFETCLVDATDRAICGAQDTEE